MGPTYFGSAPTCPPPEWAGDAARREYEARAYADLKNARTMMFAYNIAAALATVGGIGLLVLFALGLYAGWC